MSLMPKHLTKTAVLLKEKALPATKVTFRQWGLVTSLTFVLLSGCQEQPKIAPTVTPTATATAAATNKDKEGVLERVKARGKLLCGVNGKLSGFSYVDDKGLWSGLDVDYCRAIAAAVLGDARAVEFKPLLAKDRFTAIQNGEIDILMRNTTRTLTRDVTPNISFAPTTFFDGQGVMLRIGAKPNSPNSSPSASPSPSSSSPSSSASPSASPSSAPESRPDRPDKDGKSDKDSKSDKPLSKASDESAIALKELTDKKICVETGINAANLESTFKEANIAIEAMVLPDLDSVLNAYTKGDCDAISSEKSQLASWRSKLPRPADHKILDLSLSKEPLSPALVGNDDRWRDVVTWVIYATFYAEELGINMDNYNIFKDTKNPEVSRFLGTSDSLGIELGLAPDWTTQILKQVGNYNDIYSRNITPLDIPRGLNRQWKQGGLLYSMPFR
ncbi:amino acid ABC transporter substrate-binding protein [Pseudanabaena sp. UWO310]|uniref:amino acid ABC transporter substrate-binding protein n=1 Tax=Pseudanabaena sp. UWO310 TaxID=2480795 RepID=UPI00115C2CA9|nr:amino acid ABC transporter substrate-binding protein [Pseudanabaena sp. UWO310]TYQ30795.1 amino acid ABC transporter substrate-binding protein [Pseudanabaena sp. UWO310]